MFPKNEKHLILIVLIIIFWFFFCKILNILKIYSLTERNFKGCCESYLFNTATNRCERKSTYSNAIKTFELSAL